MALTESERRAKQRYNARNLEKNRARSLRYYYSHREHLNRKASQKRTGWSPEQYADALRRQNGQCAICSAKPERKALCGDHDHITGQRRGLLCDRCNLGLAKFDERADLLLLAADYLRSYKE